MKNINSQTDVLENKDLALEELLRKKYADYLVSKLTIWWARELGTSNADIPNCYEIPEQIWHKLSECQDSTRVKLQKLFKVYAGKVKDGEISTSVEEMLDNLYQLDPKARKALLAIIGNSRFEPQNPTFDKLVMYVKYSSMYNSKLRISMSQCIGKEQSVRLNSLLYFTNQIRKSEETEFRKIKQDKFLTTVEKKGWDNLKKILDQVEMPIEATIFLGDMDFMTMNRCDQWCDEESLQRLEIEIKQMQERTQIEADEYFGVGKVKVRLWSEEYNLDECSEMQEKAKSDDSWRTEKLMRQSISPYIKSWGYDRIFKEIGMSEKQIEVYIVDDVIRTAGQYRLEANVLMRSTGIQAWAECAANPLWPLTITNFDGRGLPPTILLT